MPAEVEVEGLIKEDAKRVANEDEDHDGLGEEDAFRTGTVPREIYIGSHNAGKPIHTNNNGGYSNYVERLETGNQKYIWAPFTSRMEWEVAQWAKLHGPGSTLCSEFLEIEGVSQIH
jgi:hypothetical protein